MTTRKVMKVQISQMNGLKTNHLLFLSLLPTLNNEKTIVLWATNYGVPIYTSRFVNVVILPEDHKNPPSQVVAAN
jgi:deoxyhypusine synthase